MASTSSASSAQDAPTSTPTYIDTATDCAICLSPLADEEVITLHCGHRWHLACIKAQLKTADLTSSSRLLFSGCRCAKCNAFCDHPALDSALRANATLSSQVDALILEQLRVDGVATDRADALAIGRSSYAFYRCSICSNPYFGGTVACADAEDDILPPGDRMCPTCTPHSWALCAHNTHAAFHVWKCRFCCSSASHLCYGTTHFCDSCHERDRVRVRGEAMPPVECPGLPACSSPMRRGQERHSNGASHESEQILHCSLCASDPTGVGARVDVGNVSDNLIYNPSAALGLRGWLRGGNSYATSWSVEQSETRFRDNEHNFVSGFYYAIMSQVVDLRAHLARPGNACVEVSARYMARWDCPSMFMLMADTYTAAGLFSGYRKLASYCSGVLDAPVGFWEAVKHIFEPQEGVAFVVVTVVGKDRRCWRGEYGSKVTDISVRVRFDESTATPDELLTQPVDVEEPSASDMRPLAEQSWRDSLQNNLRGDRVR